MDFYEHTLIAKQDLSSAEIEKVQSKYNDIINGTSGKVVKIEKWGLLNFARKIRNYNKGFYIHYKFEGNNKTIDEIKKKIHTKSSFLFSFKMKIAGLVKNDMHRILKP